MYCMLQPDLDALDLELVERAVQGALDVIEFGTGQAELESDEDLELALRRELAEMVRASGVSNADVLLDIMMEGMGKRIS